MELVLALAQIADASRGNPGIIVIAPSQSPSSRSWSARAAISGGTPIPRTWRDRANDLTLEDMFRS